MHSQIGCRNLAIWMGICVYGSETCRFKVAKTTKPQATYTVGENGSQAHIQFTNDVVIRTSTISAVPYADAPDAEQNKH